MRILPVPRQQVVDNPIANELMVLGSVSNMMIQHGDPQYVVIRYRNTALSDIRSIIHKYTRRPHATGRIDGTCIDQDIYVNIDRDGWMPWKNVVYENVGTDTPPTAVGRFNPSCIIDIIGREDDGITRLSEESNENKQIGCEEDIW